MKKIDLTITPIYNALLRNVPTTLLPSLNDWQLEQLDDDVILYYKDKLYIPDDWLLCHDILRMFHDHETIGHPGELEMYNGIRHHYWWPGL